MDPRLEFHMYTTTLPPSEGMGNTVTIVLDAVAEEIHQDPTTGIQTLIESNPVHSSPFTVEFSIGSTCRSHIRDLLLDRLMNHPSSSESLATPIASLAWFWEWLASRIASAASDLGFGSNGFEIALFFIAKYQRVSPAFPSESVLRTLVCDGTIDGEEELKKLKMETEPCSICLEDLSASKTGGAPTRMPCSHVFHDLCLLEWFRRKSTCPMCRRALVSA